MQNICQSCGMPMTTEEHYGTNEDGIPNYDYCVHCWQKGEFTNPTDNLDEFVDKMLEAMEADPDAPRMGREEAKDMLENLSRWKKES